MLAGFFIFKPTHVFGFVPLAFKPAPHVFLLAFTVLAGCRDPDVARDHKLPSRGAWVSIFEYIQKQTKGKSSKRVTTEDRAARKRVHSKSDRLPMRVINFLQSHRLANSLLTSACRTEALLEPVRPVPIFIPPTTHFSACLKTLV